MERALLFVDGNAGCALLGENLQTGEVEFIECNYERSKQNGTDAERVACTAAYRKLKERLPEREFSYVWQSPSDGPWWGQRGAYG